MSAHGWELSDVTRNVRSILKLFDIEVPKEPMYHTEMFDPAAIIGPVIRGETLFE